MRNETGSLGASLSDLRNTVNKAYELKNRLLVTDAHLSIQHSSDIIGDVMSRKVADDICPDCGDEMAVRTEPSVLIDRIFHTCSCGFNRKDFV